MQQVKQVTSDLFFVPVEAIDEDSSSETIEQWDSLQHLNLVLALEEVFAVELTPEDIEQMRTIGAIANLIECKLSGQPATPAMARTA
jgi:acyl carrier protein